MTPECEINTCSKRSVHIVYSVQQIDSDTFVRVKLHLCPEHFNQLEDIVAFTKYGTAIFSYG